MNVVVTLVLTSYQVLKRYMTAAILLVAMVFGYGVAYAEGEEHCDSTEVYFKVSSAVLDLNLNHNGEHLQAMVDSLQYYAARDSLYELKKIKVVGAASPEGTVQINYVLSRKRAERIFDFFSSQLHMPDSLTEFSYLGRD